MERNEAGLIALGDRVAALSEAMPGRAAALGAARRKWLAGMRRRPSRTRLVWWTLPGLAVAAAAVGVALWPQAGVEMIGGEEPGALIEARAAERAIQFSDGTQIILLPGTQARVERVLREGAEVTLRDGRAQVSVTPRGGARWTFRAGPFEVQVTGTRFLLGWDQAAERLAVDMQEGSVVVRGACVSDERRLAEGQSVSLSCRRLTVQAVQGPSATPALRPAPRAAERPVLRAAERPTPARRIEAPRAAPAGEDWRAHYENARYAQAVAAAERAGFPRLLATSSTVDLLALGDAARLARAPARAEQAYETVRRRFPREAGAALAAYSLGRIAADERRAYDEAARLFALYMKELPDGPLAPEAAGRLMDTSRRAGDLAAARRHARAYLDRYRDGPYAGLARSLVDER